MKMNRAVGAVVSFTGRFVIVVIATWSPKVLVSGSWRKLLSLFVHLIVFFH